MAFLWQCKCLSVGGVLMKKVQKLNFLWDLGRFWNFQNWTYTPFFGRAAKILRFHTPKIAKVGLRMKVEIVQIQFFSEKISIFRATFSKNWTFYPIFVAKFSRKFRNWSFYHDFQPRSGKFLKSELKLSFLHPFLAKVQKLNFFRDLSKKTKSSLKTPPP